MEKVDLVCVMTSSTSDLEIGFSLKAVVGGGDSGSQSGLV